MRHIKPPGPEKVWNSPLPLVLASLGQCPREVRGQRLCIAVWGLDLPASIMINKGAHAYTPLPPPSPKVVHRWQH